MDQTLIAMAMANGFTHAEVLPVQELIFDSSFRKYCEENKCGNFGTNYACPPYCGTPEQMKERVMSYAHALVMMSRFDVENALDPAQVIPTKKLHMERTSSLVREAAGLPSCKDSMLISGSPCMLCGECCMKRDLPCPHPEERYSCVSAYCLDVTALAKACGMEISWELNQISYFSMFLFGRGAGAGK